MTDRLNSSLYFDFEYLFDHVLETEADIILK